MTGFNAPSGRPATEAGQVLAAYLSQPTVDLEPLWQHEANPMLLVGPIFTLLVRQRFGRPPNVQAITAYVCERRTVDTGLDLLAAEAAIRLTLDQGYVSGGMSDEEIQLAIMALWRPLATEMLKSSDEVDDLVSRAEDLLAAVLREVANG